MKRLALLALLLAGCGQPQAVTWTYPDGLYSLSFAQGWTVSEPADKSALFFAQPRGGSQSQCWATVTPSPLSPCGTSQQCLNAALGEMVVEDPDSIGFTLERGELNTVAIADTRYEKTGLYWRGAAFALPHPPGLEMHDIRCVAALPASEADKAALDEIVSSLKFGAVEN